MLSLSNQKLLDFLEREKHILLEQWNKEIVLTETDPFKDYIRENGEAMFSLILTSLSKSEQDLDVYLQQLAIKIASQRVKANINIGEFVYNVNMGRSIIYKNLNRVDVHWDDLQKWIDRINVCFDKFLYYAVSHYTDAKNKIIDEKTEFINSTHKDRLTLLGQMTSSFIHEFRNPLTSIQGFVQLLKAENPPMNYLDIISNELEQLNFRISQFLLLSKKELIGKEKTTFNLNSLVEEVLIFLYPSILDAKVRIIKEVDESTHLCGYEDEIRQVLINIIFNAIDVLNPYREDPLIEIISFMTADSYVRLEIRNNGPQIPEHLLSSIFEPFVTTKKLGTGLGLFVCREIIEKHKGFLSCESDYDQTIFSMTLPLHTGERAADSGCE